MKSIKLTQKHVQEISRGKLSKLIIANDDQDITVDDHVEVVSDNTNEAIGYLIVNEVNIKRLGTFPDSQDVLIDLSAEQANDPNKPAKKISFKFKPYNKSRPVSQTDVKKYTNLTEVKMYSDGGSRGNPGPSASGWLVTDMGGKVVAQGGLYLGLTTNNQAEYQSLKLGLKGAKRLGVKKVHVFMDSLLVINQMKGIFKVKNKDLWPIHASIKELVESFEEVTFTHIPRELNKAADAIVNETLDAV